MGIRSLAKRHLETLSLDPGTGVSITVKSSFAIITAERDGYSEFATVKLRGTE